MHLQTEVRTWSYTCFSFLLPVSQWKAWLLPSPARPLATLPTINLCLKRDSASFTACWASHFLPVLILILAPDTFSSFESLYWSTWRTFDTLYSSVMELKGNCILLLFPYGAILLRFLGKPSHLLMYPLILISYSSMLVIVNSYTKKGHTGSLVRIHAGRCCKEDHRYRISSYDSRFKFVLLSNKIIHGESKLEVAVVSLN